VQFRFASQPGVCGDGVGSIENVLGRRSRFYTENGITSGKRDLARPCLPGPARVVVNVASGQVVNLKTYVGPEFGTPSSVTDLGVVPVSEAVPWLTRLVMTSEGRVASDAMVPLVIADGSSPWRDFSKIATDSSRSRGVRRQALFWMGEGAIAKLGIGDARSDATDEDDVKAEAVFSLSQIPRERSLPELMRLARTSTNASIRAAAIFWLGQTGDSRAAEVFRELLGIR
jgi:HEAT repeat protein